MRRPSREPRAREAADPDVLNEVLLAYTDAVQRAPGGTSPVILAKATLGDVRW